MKSGLRAACDSCHRRKTRCIVLAGNVCQYCRQSGHRCVYSPRSNMARPRHEQQSRIEQQNRFEQQNQIEHQSRFESQGRFEQQDAVAQSFNMERLSKRRFSRDEELPLLSPPFTTLDLASLQQHEVDLMAETYSPTSYTLSSISPTLPTDADSSIYNPSLSPKQTNQCTSLTATDELAPATAEDALLEPAGAQLSVVPIYAELSQLLFMINEETPQDIVGKDGRSAFESVSALVSSLCEILSFLDSQSFAAAADADAAEEATKTTTTTTTTVSPCLLLAISVAGSVSRIYHRIAQSLNDGSGGSGDGGKGMALPQSLHRMLQVLADAQTMEYQLVYMRRMCKQSQQELGRNQTLARIDATLALLRNYSQSVRSGRLQQFMPL